jgi:hypothetical protein
MPDDRDGINRQPGTDPYLNRRPRLQTPAYGWSIPVGIAALFILAGFLFFNSGGHGWQPASLSVRNRTAP